MADLPMNCPMQTRWASAPFSTALLRSFPSRPTPLKVFEQTPMDYSSLVLSCLSRELNRTVFCYGTDISFAQVPTDIAVAAFRGQGALRSRNSGQPGEANRSPARAALSKPLYQEEALHRNVEHRRLPAFSGKRHKPRSICRYSSLFPERNACSSFRPC